MNSVHPILPYHPPSKTLDLQLNLYAGMLTILVGIWIHSLLMWHMGPLQTIKQYKDSSKTSTRDFSQFIGAEIMYKTTWGGIPCYNPSY